MVLPRSSVRVLPVTYISRLPSHTTSYPFWWLCMRVLSACLGMIDAFHWTLLFLIDRPRTGSRCIRGRCCIVCLLAWGFGWSLSRLWIPLLCRRIAGVCLGALCYRRRVCYTIISLLACLLSLLIVFYEISFYRYYLLYYLQNEVRNMWFFAFLPSTMEIFKWNVKRHRMRNHLFI